MSSQEVCTVRLPNECMDMRKLINEWMSILGSSFCQVTITTLTRTQSKTKPQALCSKPTLIRKHPQGGGETERQGRVSEVKSL